MRSLRRDPVLLACRIGRWSLIWAVLGTFAVLAGSIGTYFLASEIDTAVANLFGGPLDADTFVVGRPDTFFAMLTFAASLILPAILVTTILHRTSWRLLLGADGRFAWATFWKAAGAFALVYIAATLVDVMRHPGQYALQNATLSHIPWLLLGMLAILPQAFAEDIVFKGYLTRVWGAVLPIRPLLIVGMAALFASVHAGNTDVAKDLWFNLASMLIGELVAFAIYLRTMSLAAATGIHWMNNVHAMCLVATLPGYDNPFAVAVYTDPVLAAGGSHLLDPQAWLELGVVTLALWLLLTNARSPFHLAPVAVPEMASAAPDGEAVKAITDGEAVRSAPPPAETEPPAA